MKGTIISIKADGTSNPVTLDRAPDLDDLRAAIGGGYIEAVPGFHSVATDAGVVMDCAVFCDEEGKLKNLPLNRAATNLWELALNRQGASLRTGVGGLDAADVLCGTIAVVYGDREFMDSL